MLVEFVLAVLFLPSACSFSYGRRPLRPYVCPHLNAPRLRIPRPMWHASPSLLWRWSSSSEWNCYHPLHQSVQENQDKIEKSSAIISIESETNNTKLSMSPDGKDDPILLELEDVATNRQDIVMMNNRSELEQYKTVLGDLDDERNSVLMDIIAVLMISGVVGFAVYSLFAASPSASGDTQDNSNLFDWKDLVAYTAGETFSSSMMRGLLFFGELSVFRFLNGELSKDQPKNDDEIESEKQDGFISRLFSSNPDDEDEDVDWRALSTDVGSWIIYAYLKDDILGGEIGISNSALESAVLGLVAAWGAKASSDVVLFNSDIFSNSNEARIEGSKLSLQQWIQAYLKSGFSAAVLFSVYDLALRMLETNGY